MTRARPRNRMTAWLGLFAMWLIVFAPIVSQGLVSSFHGRDTAAAPMCSVDEHHHMGDHAGTVHFAACGYCDLLLHHVAAPTPAMPQLLFAAHYGVAQPPVSAAFVHREVFAAARPRDSPLLV